MIFHPPIALRREIPVTRNQSPIRTAGLVLAWTSLSLLPLLATGCHQKEAGAETSTIVEVETTNPVRKDLVREIEQPGVLMPWEITPIYTKMAGFAKEFQHNMGDRVKKDELLLE